jgi:pimeloyl-ACP methyl ester carboxylesterase
VTTSTNHSGLGAGRYILTGAVPANTTTSAVELRTHDRAAVSGVLRTVPGANVVVTVMHPRQDSTHHPMVPELLRRGYAVWTQGARSINNDLSLVHEQTLLDYAAGQVFLRDRGFDTVVSFGHSGGGTLTAFYLDQASLSASARIAVTPAGRPVGLDGASMPVPDAAIFMAPHPGQGKLLARLIDPSVNDESDPLGADPDLNPFRPENGFAAPPHSSSYGEEFIDRYRQAQAARVRRIDEFAAELASTSGKARAAFDTTGDADERRKAIAPRVFPIYRTDADLRSVDLSIDANDRPYGSLFGRRPDLTNYGLTGFARLCTPESWLSTWSANTSNAAFLNSAPRVKVPSLLIELTGDQACFPDDARQMFSALGAEDKTHVRVRGRHFGGSIVEGEPTGVTLAAARLEEWLTARYPTRGELEQL